MADMLTIGTAATNSFKRALDVTSQNVANVSTEGYSRQRAEIVSNTPNSVGLGFQGGGSRVETIERIHAGYLQSQMASSQSLVERYDTQVQLANQVEGIIASNDQGIQEFLQGYFDALQSLSNNPTSDTSRQMLIDEGKNLQSHIGNLTAVLDDTQYQLNSQIGGLADEINSRLETIQAVNIQVERANRVGQQAPNELLDQRDQAVLELSQYMDIKTFPQDSGRLDIHTANGRLPLLSDNTITRLETDRSPFGDDNRTEVYMSIGGQRQLIGNQITGGQLGGALDFRDNLLEKAKNDLGLTLNGLSASMNWQHYQGYDSNGDAGGNLFTPLSMNATNNTRNSGVETGTNILVSFNPNAGVSEPPYDGATALSSQPATFGDKETYLQNAFTEIGRFESRSYELRYNQATDEFDFFDFSTQNPLLDSSGNPVSLARGAVGNIEGMSFDLSGVTTAPDDRDSFLVKPHQAILTDFSQEMVETEKVATRGQSPIDTNADGSILDEVPASAAAGDNVNISNLAGLQSAKLLLADSSDVGSETLLGGYSKMATNVGMYVRGSEVQLTAQTNVFQQITDQRDSISGVSLDEEAANLMRYQQAYEAAAQIIATSQTIFQTILDAVRR
ncbi:Flagellar hook-associated protein FlgK [hydrothermal vent metagenome]|uniref:Flagellar hook-associated protein FlgK n=1 Tax=hydrothermal vent metagenome TaxID=652676 RepID=A0A3B0WW54_9ZZZZ